MLTVYIGSEPSAPDTPTETAITVIDAAKGNLAIQVSWEAPTDNGAPVTGY